MIQKRSKQTGSQNTKQWHMRQKNDHMPRFSSILIPTIFKTKFQCNQTMRAMGDSNHNLQNASYSNLKTITALHQVLRVVWFAWLIYRLFALPILVATFAQNSKVASDQVIFAGIFWQALWLVPAFVLSFWIIHGRSAYALLMGSLLTLLYLGASGMLVLQKWYELGQQWAWVYLLDFILLFIINVCIFLLLKRLPSMNKYPKN